MRFEGGKTIGTWTLVSDVDDKLAAPLWVGDDGDHVAYVRNYRVRSIQVTRRLGKVVDIDQRIRARETHDTRLPNTRLQHTVDFELIAEVEGLHQAPVDAVQELSLIHI